MIFAEGFDHCRSISIPASNVVPVPINATIFSAPKIPRTCRWPPGSAAQSLSSLLTFAGKYFPAGGAKDLTRETLDEWYSYYHQCSQCRRCSVFCPYGIDTAEISMAAREILDSIGYGQKYCNEIIAKVNKIGNNLGLPGPALADTLEGLEEDVEDETGVAVKYPLDVKGRYPAGNTLRGFFC